MPTMVMYSTNPTTTSQIVWIYSQKGTVTSSTSTWKTWKKTKWRSNSRSERRSSWTNRKGSDWNFLKLFRRIGSSPTGKPCQTTEDTGVRFWGKVLLVEISSCLFHQEKGRITIQSQKVPNFSGDRENDCLVLQGWF